MYRHALSLLPTQSVLVSYNFWIPGPTPDLLNQHLQFNKIFGLCLSIKIWEAQFLSIGLNPGCSLEASAQTNRLIKSASGARPRYHWYILKLSQCSNVQWHVYAEETTVLTRKMHKQEGIVTKP